jgi:hypothetical protein
MHLVTKPSVAVLATHRIDPDGLSTASTRVFVLGSLERNITIRSQQVRALNLIAALRETETLGPSDRIAVIGGGPAGLTAAAAAASIGHHVDVYESADDVLDTFGHATGRWVHPRFFEWPNAGWDRPNAGLPFFNWNTGTIDAAVKSWKNDWEFYKENYSITLRCAAKVKVEVDKTHETPMVSGTYLDDDGESHVAFDPYSIVILAIGFNGERVLPGMEDTFQPYWQGQPDAGEDDVDVVVVGAGDGGIQDLLRYAVADFNWADVLRALAGDTGPLAIAAKFARDAEPIGNDARFDEIYRNTFNEVPSLAKLLVDNRRPGVKIRIATRSPYLYTRASSPINRLVLRHLMESKLETTHCSHIAGIDIERVQYSGQVTMLKARKAGRSPKQSHEVEIECSHVIARPGVVGPDWSDVINGLKTQTVKSKTVHPTLEKLASMLRDFPELSALNLATNWRNMDEDFFSEAETFRHLSKGVREIIEDLQQQSPSPSGAVT